jgi:hypothetical protein
MNERALATVAVQAYNEGIEIKFACSVCGTTWAPNLLADQLTTPDPVLECPNACISDQRASTPEDFHADGSLRVRV